MAGTILSEMVAGDVSGAGASGSAGCGLGKLKKEQARRVIWLPSGLLIWDSLCKREEPVSVGVAFDPKIHASMSHKRSVA